MAVRSISTEADGVTFLSLKGDVAELSPYEAACSPLHLLPRAHSTTLSASVVNEFVTCPVCLGVIKDASTVMVCLHRFCHECIRDSLRLGKKECPKCRTKVATHRDLRPDTSFDALIAALLGDVEQYEKAEQHKVSAINHQFNRAHLRESFESGVKRQRRAVRKLGHIPIELDEDDQKSKLKSVTFEMRVAADGGALPQLRRKFVSAPPQATVSHMRQFLVKQLALAQPAEKVTLSLYSQENVLAEDGWTLKQVLRFALEKKIPELRLLYGLDSTSCN
eukprot:TRINITY_DN6147_c0_g1_i6.p1 TRINITY_DN6147_c0_g1~~TRINITY_DN6147_c0_g1_i6.p1  ORF type:complete len:278 (-),score=75.41 TRINITY_DN6147_c0_g1_i6:52-885(-)